MRNGLQINPGIKQCTTPAALSAADSASEGIPNERVVEKVGGLRLPASRSSQRELRSQTAPDPIGLDEFLQDEQ